MPKIVATHNGIAPPRNTIPCNRRAVCILSFEPLINYSYTGSP